MNLFFEGFILQASLILALGAQNIFVLESGLKKQRHLLVAFICSVCDSLLIAIGVLGAATLFLQIPILKSGFGVIGVLFLAYYGFKKLKEGLSFNNQEKFERQGVASLRQIVLVTLGFSLLNPHVYLDTIVLIGGYATQFPRKIERVYFGLGAASFSVIWFYGLALFSSALSGFLKRKKIMKAVAVLSGVLLLLLACKLSVDVYSWIAFYPIL